MQMPANIAILAILCQLQVVAQVQTPVCLPFSCQSVVVAGSSQTLPLGVNAAGDIVGRSPLNFLLHAGTLSQFAAPGGGAVYGIGADNIVGTYSTAFGGGFLIHGFIMPTANFTDFTSFTTIDVPNTNQSSGSGTS